MMHLIESFDDSEATATLDGRTFPALCLVEDDQSIRWFVTSNTLFVHAHTWMRAASSGAAALLVPLVDGYAVMTIETFMEERSDFQDGYAITPKQWITFASLPSYSDLVNWVAPERERTGLVHLHNHSEYSALDGMSTMQEIADVIAEQDGFAFGTADHGNCAGHPEQQKICDQAGLKPIFGMEAYLVNDRKIRLVDYDNELIRARSLTPNQTPSKTLSAEEKVARTAEEKAAKEARAAFLADVQDYFHLVLFAVDQEGLHNLWAMTTASYQDGFYGKPRMDWEILAKYSKGVIATSACLRGPLTHHGLLEDNGQEARNRLGRLLEIFGDRFYIEIHCNQLPEQVKVNRELVDLAREFKIPLLASVDSHYPKIEDQEAHRVWLSVQTNSDMADETTLFAGGQDYHIKTEDQVRADLAYLGQEVVDEAIANTAVIANMCTAKVTGETKPPIFSQKGGAEADVERLLDICMDNWHKILGKREPEEVYMARFEHEFPMLVRKGFCGYYLMTSEGTRWARRVPILVGPGRGSGAGSLVAYLAEITDIDPVDADLLFERFMTEGRTALPDFDVDYPASKKAIVQQHARDVYGDDHVVVVGSVMRLKNKGIIKKLGTAMKSVLPDSFYMDQQRIAKIITEAEADTAGLGLSWEDLWDKAGEELQPYRDQYPHLFAMADRLVGRVAGFGQHASGLVITTDAALTEQLPMRRAEEGGHMIAQWDKDVLEALGYVKFDLLTIRNLDIVQRCIDLIRQRRGHVIDVYSWRDEYTDPQVWEEIAEARTLGLFQIHTQLGTQYAKRMRPKSLADLSDLVTIVRPGPRNSGLTETYLRRRDGIEPVTYPDPRMEEFLAKTHGTLLYQEDIMKAVMVLAGYDSNKADDTRRMLGKKQVEKVVAAGKEFVACAVENGMNTAAATSLWAQMAEFAKYSFGRAHAYSYAVLGYWEAWLKFHYQVEFLTAALSYVDKDEIPDFVKEARRMGFAVLPPDINESGSGFRAGTLSVRYGLDSIKGIGMAAVHIEAGQPFTSFEDFMERMVEPKGSKVNRGHVALLAKIGAFDSLVPNRRGLEQILLSDKTGDSTKCVRKNLDVVNVVNDLPCMFDWSTEEPPINPRTGKKMKLKAPPKKCTKACRQYIAPPPVEVKEVAPYKDVDIRNIEQELLGVYLSSTPFDMLSDEEREHTRAQADQLINTQVPGMHIIAGILLKMRPYRDKSGREMGFLTLETEIDSVDITCFSDVWLKYKRDLRVGAFYALDVERNSRGHLLNYLMTADQLVER